jgi:hypothetical protein
MPGFVSYKDYAAADGESLALVEFQDERHAAGVAHASGARAGAGHLSEYHAQVCTPTRAYASDRQGGRRDLSAS